MQVNRVNFVNILKEGLPFMDEIRAVEKVVLWGFSGFATVAYRN